MAKKFKQMILTGISVFKGRRQTVGLVIFISIVLGLVLSVGSARYTTTCSNDDYIRYYHYVSQAVPDQDRDLCSNSEYNRLSATVIMAISTSFVASAMFFLLIFYFTDRHLLSAILRFTKDQMIDFAGILHKEFVPSGHFNIETKHDQEFWFRSNEIFRSTQLLYYSGPDARTSLARMYSNSNQELKRALFRIPLSNDSIGRAIKIRQKLVAHDLSRTLVNKEIDVPAGLDSSERPKDGTVYKLVNIPINEDTKRDYETVKRYVVERVYDCMRFALFVSKNYSAELLIKDWDETNNFRTEFMDDAIFLGNYHTRGEYSRFSPGTCQFPKSSFIHRIMEPGILLQIESAAAEASSKWAPPPATDAPGAPATQAAAERAPAPPPATDAPDAPATQAAAERAPASPPATDPPGAHPTKPLTLRIKGDRKADMIFNFWLQTEAGRIYYEILEKELDPESKLDNSQIEKTIREQFINEKNIESSIKDFVSKLMRQEDNRSQ